jgi:2-haloacid dehalogenase
MARLYDKTLKSMNSKIETVIFDLGGVLIDWNPQYVFRRVFDGDEEQMNFFLSEICSPEWNLQQDAGRPLAEATEWLVSRHPEYEEEIRAYYGRWEEMLGGAIHETVAILEELHERNSHRLYALTNWSHETFPVARDRFGFLNLFEGIVVSGEEKMKKPDARIYQLLLERYEVKPDRALFIDDNYHNIESARAIGLHTTLFESPGQLKEELINRGVLGR